MNLKWNLENLSQVFWKGTHFQVSFDTLLLMVMHPFTFQWYYIFKGNLKTSWVPDMYANISFNQTQVIQLRSIKLICCWLVGIFTIIVNNPESSSRMVNLHEIKDADFPHKLIPPFLLNRKVVSCTITYRVVCGLSKGNPPAQPN